MTVEDDRGEDFDVDIDDDIRDDDDDYTPPTREEHERMKRALSKANAEAKKNRLRFRELLAKSSDKSGDDKPDKDRELERERIRHEASEAEEARWKTRVVRQAARAALLEAGLQGDPTKLARLIDANEVEIDDDGEIADGLEEQIDSLKEDYPDLFEDKSAPQKSSTRRSRIDGGNRERPPARKLTSAEKIQQQVLKTARRR